MKYPKLLPFILAITGVLFAGSILNAQPVLPTPVSANLDPSVIDIGRGGQDVLVEVVVDPGDSEIYSVYVYLETGEGRKYAHKSLQMLDSVAVEGTSHLKFSGILTFATNRERLGTYSLVRIGIRTLDNQYLYYGNSIYDGNQFPPLPAACQQDLEVIAEDPLGATGAGYGIQVENIFGLAPFHSIQAPVFCDMDGAFLPTRDINYNTSGRSLPSLALKHHLLRSGEERPVMLFFQAFQHFRGGRSSVSLDFWNTDIYPAPDLEFSIRRYYTEDWFLGGGDIQEIVEVPESEGAVLPGEWYVFDMRSDGYNAPTWGAVIGYLIKPPPGGFRDDFQLLFTHESLVLPEGGSIYIRERAAIGGVYFDVINEPPEPTLSREDGQLVVRWFTGEFYAPCDIRSGDSLGDPVTWPVIGHVNSGSSGYMQWTDASPDFGTSGKIFYSVDVPEPAEALSSSESVQIRPQKAQKKPVREKHLLR